MLNQSSPLDAFSAAPQSPQTADPDGMQTGKKKIKRLKKQGKKQQRKLKKSRKEIRRLKQQLECSQGNLEEIRLRCQAEAQRDCYRAMTLALSKRLRLEDFVPQIALPPAETEE